MLFDFKSRTPSPRVEVGRTHGTKTPWASSSAMRSPAPRPSPPRPPGDGHDQTSQISRHQPSARTHASQPATRRFDPRNRPRRPEEARWLAQFAVQRAGSFRALRGFTDAAAAVGRWHSFEVRWSSGSEGYCATQSLLFWTRISASKSTARPAASGSEAPGPASSGVTRPPPVGRRSAHPSREELRLPRQYLRLDAGPGRRVAVEDRWIPQLEALPLHAAARQPAWRRPRANSNSGQGGCLLSRFVRDERLLWRSWRLL